MEATLELREVLHEAHRLLREARVGTEMLGLQVDRAAGRATLLRLRERRCE